MFHYGKKLPKGEWEGDCVDSLALAHVLFQTFGCFISKHQSKNDSCNTGHTTLIRMQSINTIIVNRRPTTHKTIHRSSSTSLLANMHKCYCHAYCITKWHAQGGKMSIRSLVFGSLPQRYQPM